MLLGQLRLRTKVLAAAAAMAAMLAGTNPSRAIDVDPGEYTVLPAGTNLAILYALYGERSSVNIVGAGTFKATLNSSIGIARYVHYFNLASMPAAVHVLLPFGSLYNGNIPGVTGPLQSASGLGDLIGAFTVWPINKPDPMYSTTLGLTVFESMPTGSYNDRRVLNVGANRWATTLQAGFIQGIGKGLFFDLTGDATFYGDNSDAFGLPLTQDPSYEVQAYLRYHFLPTTAVSVGYAGTFGGTQYLNGVANGFKTEFSQVRAVVQHFIAPNLQGEIMVGRDFAVTGGFEQDFFTKLRFVFIF